jgi:hypothetical protein
MVLCMAEVDGKTQRLAFSKTIDADAAPRAVNEHLGGVNLTVNIVSVVSSGEGRVGSDRKDRGTASRRYWMDSLPCLSTRSEFR